MFCQVDRSPGEVHGWVQNSTAAEGVHILLDNHFNMVSKADNVVVCVEKSNA